MPRANPHKIWDPIQWSVCAPTRGLHQAMGNCCSSTADPVPHPVQQRDLTLQAIPQPSIPPSIPAPIPSVDPSVSEIRRPRSRPGSIKSVKSARRAPQGGPSYEPRYERPRVKSAPQPPQKLHAIKMEEVPPLPLPVQRSRAKSSTASSSRSPNSDHRQTSAGEHEDSQTRVLYLTMIRKLKGIS